MKETTAKERLLKKVRKALLEKRDNPYPSLEDLPLYPIYNNELEYLFAEQLIGVKGHFTFCENTLDVIDNLISLTEANNWLKIYCWEPSMQTILKEFDFPFYEGDKDFANADVGITGCEFLIARNGSILVSNKNESGRRLSIYPPNHIVIAYTSQLVLDLKDAFLKLKEKYKNQLPSMISTITGPSRTADIEKTLVLGAHGPKELYVFLIDDLI